MDRTILPQVESGRIERAWPKTPAALQKFTDRFWAKITKTETCWLWTGARTVFGYGLIGLPGEHSGNSGTHRVAFWLNNGPFDESLFVLHKCDNPACVNPDHLFLGTAKDNILDCVRKGRQTKPSVNNSRHGVTHHSAKLTAEQVRQVRGMHRTGAYNYRMLAETFGVSRSTIGDICNANSYRAELAVAS